MNDYEPSVAIFWDYENCTPPCAARGCDIVDNIRQIAHEYGSVKLFKAYLELSEQSLFNSNRLRSELQSSGVSLTDCPHNGKKDVADKMMIVDMLTFAIDTPAPATIVMISGDRDFVYAVSTLRLRKYQVVLVVSSTAHYSLKSQASALLDWGVDVLHKPARDCTERPVETGPTSNTNFGVQQRARSSFSPAVVPSPDLEQPQGCSCLRDVNSGPTTKMEPLQSAAHINSARLQTRSVQTIPATDVTGDAERSTPSLPGPTTSTPSPSIISLPAFSDTIVTVQDAELRTSTGTRHIPDLHMQLEDIEDPLLSGSSLTYQTYPPTAFQGNGKESATIAIATTPSSGVTNVPSRAEIEADSGQYILPNGPYSALTSSDSSPPPILSELHERPARLGSIMPCDKAEDDDTGFMTSTAIRPQIRASADDQHGNVAVWSNHADDVSIVIRLPPPFSPQVLSVEHPTSENSTLNNTGSLSKPQLQTVEQPAPSIKLQEELPQPSKPPAPPHFVVLLEVLENHRSRGCDAPPRSQVAYQLMQRDINAYRSAGVTRWSEYALLAKNAGIVTLGGKDASAWISLSPAWINRISVQALAASSTETSSSNNSVSCPAITSPTTTVVTLQEQVVSSESAITDKIHCHTSAPGAAILTKSTPVEHAQRNGLPEMPAVATLGVTPTDSPLESSSGAPGSESSDVTPKSDPDPPALLPIPVRFFNLLFVLEICRKSGIYRPLRSVVALALVEQNPNVYSFAGVKGWREYAAAAEKEGIVELGNIGGGAWVSLEPAWHGRASVAI